MQYSADTPADYLAELEPDWRKDKLEQLRQLILQQSNSLTECMNYKMLCYKVGDIRAFHLNAQKGYVSLYVGDIDRVDPKGELIEGLNRGKGCVRISKSKDLATTRIDEFIAKAIELAKQGINIGC